MRAGEFERAWAINDRDLAMIAYPPKHTGPRHLQRIWRGEELRGKDVLVRCYHGLGDTIQFLRFMRPLRDVARRVTVCARASFCRWSSERQASIGLLRSMMVHLRSTSRSISRSWR